VSRVVSSQARVLYGGAALASALSAFAGAATTDPAHVFAAPQPFGQPAPAGVGGLGQVTLALLVVLVAVFAVAWMVRRMRSFGSRVGSAIDILAEIPLGQKERAVLLKVGTTQVLVGVAPGSVNLLHVLSEPIDLAKPVVGPNDSRQSFRTLMLRSLGK
jgi:flagellar protein FliO/FliZ